MKRMLVLLLILAAIPAAARAQSGAALKEGTPFTITSPSVILTDALTGQTIFEKNADERRPVASVTKVMTILLTLEAIDEGRAGLDDSVTVSARANSMGGSQVFLDANKRYKLRDLLKSVIVASANDAAVALAEYMDGTEEAFVHRMNRRAQELGLENTHYVNCTGLPAQGHYTTARDVAALSAQLDRHPLYYTFSTVWMDELIHPGGRKTQLTNTNRLIRFYQGCDGYKTGSTNEARYCISATAEKNSLRLIAVVLGADAGQTRFDEARSMLEYGFSAYERFCPVKEGDALGAQVRVRMGGSDTVSALSGGRCDLLIRKGTQGEISLAASLAESVNAPIRKGDVLGEIRVMQSGQVVARIPAVAGETVELPGMVHALVRIRDHFMLSR
ncbi:MAG: D-alanyl-D-alanine carboxypeptidase [Clostridia bacterium]|nr:D-alanyl-D-alanine carboxypeptidase [Clostridia bacterium]